MSKKLTLVEAFFGSGKSFAPLQSLAHSDIAIKDIEQNNNHKILASDLGKKIDAIMAEINSAWGLEGEQDPRASATYESLHEARISILAIAQGRE